MDFDGQTLKFTKIVNFEDKTLIFSSESWDVAFFKSEQRGTLRGTGGTLFYIKVQQKMVYMGKGDENKRNLKFYSI